MLQFCLVSSVANIPQNNGVCNNYQLRVSIGDKTHKNRAVFDAKCYLLQLTMDYLTTIFALIGFLATLAWLYSSFSSLIWITYYSILGQIYPQEYSLEKRFGQWAGKLTVTKEKNATASKLPIKDFPIRLADGFKVF